MGIGVKFDASERFPGLFPHPRKRHPSEFLLGQGTTVQGRLPRLKFWKIPKKTHRELDIRGPAVVSWRSLSLVFRESPCQREFFNRQIS